jgi:hypothetical protein
MEKTQQFEYIKIKMMLISLTATYKEIISLIDKNF